MRRESGCWAKRIRRTSIIRSSALGAGQFHNYNPMDREETWHEAHNAWLQVASELGTGGLLIFAVIVGSGFVAGVQASRALRRARRARGRRTKESAGLVARREPLELYAAAVLASLTGWLIAAMFASSRTTGRCIWFSGWPSRCGRSHCVRSLWPAARLNGRPCQRGMMISVIVATRDRASLLEGTLDALCGQLSPGCPVEILVADNGSVDGTARVVEAAARRSDIPVVYLTESRPGKSHALNSAVSRARESSGVYG